MINSTRLIVLAKGCTFKSKKKKKPTHSHYCLHENQNCNGEKKIMSKSSTSLL